MVLNYSAGGSWGGTSPTELLSKPGVDDGTGALDAPIPSPHCSSPPHLPLPPFHCFFLFTHLQKYPRGYVYVVGDFHVGWWLYSSIGGNIFDAPCWLINRIEWIEWGWWGRKACRDSLWPGRPDVAILLSISKPPTAQCPRISCLPIDSNYGILKAGRRLSDPAILGTSDHTKKSVFV